MTAIKLAAFRGLSPIIAPELLPDTAAQEAYNCELDSGDIAPLHSGVAVFSTSHSGAVKTIFRIGDQNNSIWLTWDKEVTCTPGPIPELGRYYYTGDGEPRVTTADLAIIGGGGSYPSKFRVIGVPKPITAPSVSVSGGSLVDISRYYCYTFFDDWGQESAPSPLSSLITGKPDGVWVISNMDATPPNSGGITNITYVNNRVTITSNVQHFNRAGEQIKISGVSTVTNINGIWVLESVDIINKTMTFIVNNVPSGIYNSAIDTTSTWDRVAPFGLCTKRLYRTSGSTGQFQLVAENIVGDSYVDTLSDGVILGDELISDFWDMPPVGLKLIGVHPSGAMIGFIGNEVRASEPYHPYAWPKKYSLHMEYPIVAGAIYGNSIAIGTIGIPYTIYGTTPEQFTLIKHNAAYPCVSASSMVSVGYGAVYASSDGLVQISENGLELLTVNLYTRDQWQSLSPDTIVGGYAKGNIYYATKVGILVFSKTHSVVPLLASTLYVSPEDSQLYYVIGNTIYAFNKSLLTFLLASWKSKEFYFQEPKTFTAAKILFEPLTTQTVINETSANNSNTIGYNQNLIINRKTFGEINVSSINTYAVNGDALIPLGSVFSIIDNNGNIVTTLNANEVMFELFVDKTLKYTTVVSNTKPFRLPSGYKASRYAVRVSSICRIKAIELAENPIELKHV